MIVNIPIKEQVYDPDNLMKKYKINDQRLAAFLQQSQIPYCDTKAKLTNHPDQNYFKFDSHLTPVGHQQVAKAIEGCIFNIAISTSKIPGVDLLNLFQKKI